jgi:hypothetical protein
MIFFLWNLQQKSKLKNTNNTNTIITNTMKKLKNYYKHFGNHQNHHQSPGKMAFSAQFVVGTDLIEFVKFGGAREKQWVKCSKTTEEGAATSQPKILRYRLTSHISYKSNIRSIYI